MKQTALMTVLLILTAAQMQGQTAYDALMLSENNYEGTARSVAMGNAFTALGGDLGAVSINPAGSAVASYSQVTVTPGLTISSGTTSGVSPYESGELNYFEKSYRSTRTGFSFPNVGFTLNFDTGRDYGIRNFTAGFIVNQTASYNSDIYASGHNSTTSFAGQMAYEASVNRYVGLGDEKAYDNPDLPWKAVTGYQSGMFEGYDDIYVAATEKVYDDKSAFVAGELEQAYGRNVTGGKYEYLVNLGMNISDFVYLGCNFGMNTISYSYEEYFKEKAVNSADFKIEYENELGEKDPLMTRYFESLKFNSQYSFEGTGFFAKLGMIIKPVSWLRIGAAIKTPTIMSVTEKWDEEGQTDFSGPAGGSFSSLSPYGENRWTFRSPMEANIGIAAVFGRFGLISADYQICDWGNIRYRSSSYTSREDLENINGSISESYGPGHDVRLGGEFKPLPFLSLRAGYGLNVSALKNLTHQASCGIGFSTNGSFFADIACRGRFLPKEYFMPYPDYVYVTLPDGEQEIDRNYFAPEILIKESLWKVVLTLGFRF